MGGQNKGGGSMRKWYVVVLILAIFGVCLPATFTNKSWRGSDFPYIGALFLHSGDYVEFDCWDVDNGYGAFWYMVHQDRKAVVETYRYNKTTGQYDKLGLFELPSRSGSLSAVYEVGTHFSEANWIKVRLGSAYIGYRIKIVFRENTTLKYGNQTINCPENDLMIKVPEGSAVKWGGVDSRDWCDLDYVAVSQQ